MKNFSQLSGKLTALTRKNCQWKERPLPPPPDVATAFQALQTILVSEWVLAYPRWNCPNVLITQTLPEDNLHWKQGGLGAILTQIATDGELPQEARIKTISYKINLNTQSSIFNLPLSTYLPLPIPKSYT